MRHDLDKKLHQRMIDRLVKTSREHPVLRIPVICACFVILAVYHMGLSLARSAPRIVTAAASGLVLLLCSSFSHPQPEETVEPVAEYYTFAQASSQNSYDVSYAEDSGAVTDADAASLGTDGAILGDGINDGEDLAIVDLRAGDMTDSEELWNGHGGITEDDLYSADELLDGYNGEVTETVTDLPEEEILASFDADEWRLMLINKMHPIPADYEFELAVIGNGMKCDSRVKDSLLAMINAAKEDGVSLIICSPYRAAASQTYLFEIKLERFMNQGMSYTEAYEKAAQAVTIPGTSEHEVGLAFDIVTNTYRGLTAEFGETEAGKWLYEHSREYGFILRYPLGKEDITGIEYEPWHFRYVGADAATYIMDRGLTLEEFTDLLRER